jgi:nitrate reductase gamma subunit
VDLGLRLLFHGALLLVLLRHLRYFTEPVWFWVGWVQPFGLYAGFAMVAGLAGLWAAASSSSASATSRRRPTT